MAYLRCFYCNKKSSTKFLGQNKWDCPSCLATNFLDENGDITDPPVATLKTSPPRYVVRRSKSPPSRPPSRGSDSAFCATCISNQNLYIRSVAQYDFDTDTDRPGYKEDERRFYKFRKELEQRYPQVCEDCQPKALVMMRDANKVAKHDYLRRLMDKSRGRRFRAQMKGITFYGSVIFMGKFLWYIGLYTQLLWHIVLLASITQHSLYPNSDIPLSPTIATSFSIVSEYLSVTALKNWAFRSLLAGLLSLWWNPKFKHFERGSPKHITGFGDWYTQAAVLLFIRSFIFYVAGTSALSDPFATVTMACHGFAVLFITYLATVVHYTLKVDITPLWETTPEKFNVVGPKAPKPLYRPSKNELLDDMAKAVGRPRIQQPNEFGFQRASSTSPAQLAFEREKAALTRYAECEAMDWHPTYQPKPVSQHRAFAPNQPAQRSTQLFGQAPIAPEKSTFWYKVPPAPITPAHRLRNPPNQPRISPASTEAKDKFLIPMGKKIPTLPPKAEQPEEYYITQQKFFPIATSGVDESDLADMMGGFTLREDPVPPRKPKSSYWPVVSCATICGGLALAWSLYRGASLGTL